MSSFERRVPEGDDRERMICADCGHIDYQNPKVVVGTVAASDDRILMCRRAIEPRRGFWTLPAGYLELGETLEEGAVREAMEEANARLHIEGILAVFSVARIGQVQVIFRGRFADPAAPSFSAGPESLEVGLFGWDQIPWNDIAFPTVLWALDAWNARRSGPLGTPAGNPASDPRGVHRIVPADIAQQEPRL
jgi:ADP-ribose pyrophosphatase YjhB (NUDIX family)